MELSVRDWMIIVGVLLIIAVLLDGYRRVRNERRSNIRMSLNKQFLNSADLTENNEKTLNGVPIGQARSVRRQRQQQPTSTDKNSQKTVDEHFSAKDLHLEQGVPMLMESVCAQPEQNHATPPDKSTHLQSDYTTQPEQSDLKAPPQAKKTQYDPVANHAHYEHTNVEKQLITNNVDDKEVIVINVVAKDEHFKGTDLLHILLACDVRFGAMNIFHRHEKSNGKGAVQFSVANSIEPGEFDLDGIDDFSTPGVCFFMSVPGPERVIEAFDCLVETAQCLVKNLNAELRDESRSVITAQTLQHYRQRLVEFERRQLTLHV